MLVRLCPSAAPVKVFEEKNAKHFTLYNQLLKLFSEIITLKTREKKCRFHEAKKSLHIVAKNDLVGRALRLQIVVEIARLCA